jgi:hypothetical protein
LATDKEKKFIALAFGIVPIFAQFNKLFVALFSLQHRKLGRFSSEKYFWPILIFCQYGYNPTKPCDAPKMLHFCKPLPYNKSRMLQKYFHLSNTLA